MQYHSHMRFNIAFFAALMIIIVSIVSIPHVLAVILTITLVLVIIVSLGKDIPFLRPFLVPTTIAGIQSGEPAFVDKAPTPFIPQVTPAMPAAPVTPPAPPTETSPEQTEQSA